MTATTLSPSSAFALPALTPDQAFARDIPAAMTDEVLTLMSEAAHEDKRPYRGAVGEVQIHTRNRRDAINVRVEGTLTLQAYPGRTFDFQLRDGNWDGTVLEAWEEAGNQVFEVTPPTRWTLQPTHAEIAKAIANGQGRFLVQKWDALLTQERVSQIAAKYAYDSYAQPGIIVQSHYEALAAKVHMVLATEEEAAHTRAQLLKSIKPEALSR